MMDMQGGPSGLRISGIFHNCFRIAWDFQNLYRIFRISIVFPGFLDCHGISGISLGPQRLIVKDHRLRHGKKKICHCHSWLDTSFFIMGIKPTGTLEDVSLSYFY